MLSKQIALGGDVPPGYVPMDSTEEEASSPSPDPTNQSVSPTLLESDSPRRCVPTDSSKTSSPLPGPTNRSASPKQSTKRGPPPTVSVKADKKTSEIKKHSAKRKKVVYNCSSSSGTSAPIVRPSESTVTCTKLTRAVEKGDLEKVQNILNSGIPVLAVDTLGRTALHAAASALQTDIVAHLLKIKGCRYVGTVCNTT